MTGVEVDLPAAWFLLPLADEVVRDPDEVDDPPRYTKPPIGGWRTVGDEVLAIYSLIQSRADDPLTPSAVVEIDARLSRQQEWIVATWFSISQAPQLGVEDVSWINGRHRTWGLRSAGFEFAPVLLVPLGDAIHLWESDPMGWPPLDAAGIAHQQEELSRWSRSSWSVANPTLASRWSTVLERWSSRLTTAAERQGFHGSGM